MNTSKQPLTKEKLIELLARAKKPNISSGSMNPPIEPINKNQANTKALTTEDKYGNLITYNEAQLRAVN
ncbi:MAG TPA: hypothetical protein VEQ18_04870, partial [Candidatus Nitrosocosmicus sp.]|nr:hypothetical protein [Candidatus Nitrosocosmicus sp.]